MKTIPFVLRDFTKSLDENETVNLYDQSGYSEDIRIKDISDDVLNHPVIKYKLDRAFPNIHFKLLRVET